jgi:DNA gyrase inhibitor GyrI
MIKRIGIAVAILAVLVLVFAAWNGAFQSANVVEGSEGPYKLAGFYHKGPYEDIGGAFEKVGKVAKEMGWKDSSTREVQPTDRRMLGIYFDNPESKQKDSLLSFAGIQINNAADSLLLVQKYPEVKFYDIPSGNGMICDLKTSGMVSMVFAAMKAYPALGEYAEKTKCMDKVTHVFEIYHPGKTRFVMLKAAE